MAETKSKEIVAMADASSASFTAAAANNARVKRYVATFTLAAQPIADTLLLAAVPKGHVFLTASVTSSVSLGTSTIALGSRYLDPVTKAITLDATKFSNARAITSAETPILLGKSTASVERLYDSEIVATIAGAALPAAGTLVIDLLFSSVA